MQSKLLFYMGINLCYSSKFLQSRDSKQDFHQPTMRSIQSQAVGSESLLFLLGNEHLKIQPAEIFMSSSEKPPHLRVFSKLS